MIKRTLQEQIEKKFFKNKAIIVIGARQTGKTTLIKNMLDLRKEKKISIDPYTWIKLVNNDDSKLPKYVIEDGGKSLLEELYEAGKYQCEELEKQVKQLELVNNKLN